MTLDILTENWRLWPMCPDNKSTAMYNVKSEWLLNDGSVDPEKRYLDIGPHIELEKVVPTNDDNSFVQLCECEVEWITSLPGKIYNLHRRHTITKVTV